MSHPLLFSVSNILCLILYCCRLIFHVVVDHFDLNREVVSIAMNHLDRFLGAFSGTVDKNLFQLLAMTCLYLSIKLNEYKHLLIQGSTSSMDTILQLSRGFFSLEKMEKMEYEVLQLLRWHVHPPTPQLFVKHFLFFLSVSEPEVHDLAQFMVELSVMDYYFVSYKQSEVAIASLLNAMERLVPQSSIETCLPFQSQFLDIHSSRVQDCRDRLALIYAQANAIQHRTTSPVSVMAAPQPCQTEFSSKISHHHYSPPPTSMETEYSDDEEWDLGDEEEDSDL
jgi:Cyclin, C-terminal domain/Cyclin, N-terminal domain